MDERAAARANARRRTGSGTAGSGTDAAGAAGAAEVLDASYRALLDVLAGLDEDASWRPTACTGWAVRDLVFHLVMDAQRGLVALHTPAAGPPDRDATGYWADWRPGTRGAADGRRFVRVGASMFLLFDQLRGLYAETASAAARAGAAADPAARVGTQGHVLTAADLLTTLAVEATIHHLDLVARLPSAPGPSAPGLAAVRATLDGLLGRPVPLDWDDAYYARAATGRARLTSAERRALGPDADRLPLLG